MPPNWATPSWFRSVTYDATLSVYRATLGREHGKSSPQVRLIQMVLGPAIAPYGTACPSLLYSFARRPDNLARYPNR